ncbi:MAG: flagellin, partial [Oscillospiraceae bacterium]|nr:flagellin [Oscillospiraceae bacterium]
AVATGGNLNVVSSVKLQAGARTNDLQEFTFAYSSNGIGELEADLNCTSAGLGLNALTLATQTDANLAIDEIDHALNKVSMVRATFGSIQNRLEHKIANLDVSAENMQASESRIRDTDMAKEMMAFTKNQILSQASQSMLAQANSLPQGVLSLLQ